MSAQKRSSLSAISPDMLTEASLAKSDADHESLSEAQVQALAHASIKAGGEIAADSSKVKGSVASATLLTQHAITKNGVVSASTEKAPVDKAQARQLNLVALNTGKVKSAVDAPDTSPTAEQLAEIQKEGNETRAAIAEEKTNRKIDAGALSGVELKKSEQKEEKPSETMARAGMLNEIGKGGMKSVDANKVATKTRRASLTVQALTHASIKAGGEIAADTSKVKESIATATLLTQHAIKNNGVVSASTANAPVDTAKVRQLNLVALNTGRVKSAVDAPDTSPTAEQLAEIQKEGNETRAAIAEEKANRKIDAEVLAGVALKKGEQNPEKPSETMSRAGMLNQIGKGGIKSVDASKARRASLTDAHVGTAIMLGEIKKMGEISVPAEKAPDTALTPEQLAALQEEAKKEKEEAA